MSHFFMLSAFLKKVDRVQEFSVLLIEHYVMKMCVAVDIKCCIVLMSVVEKSE